MREETVKTNYGNMKLLISDNFKDKKTIILLHGWGMNKETFLKICNRLKGFNCIICDFLGFGSSDDPIKPLTINDYVETVKMIIDKYPTKKYLYLLGHSFGGRVAIAYASKYEVRKVFFDPCSLLHSAGSRLDLWPIPLHRATTAGCGDIKRCSPANSDADLQRRWRADCSIR